jgi:endonuclease G, mitochondrial
VRFGQELDRSDERGAVPVEEVIARNPDLDLALLRLAPGARSEHVIPLGTVDVDAGAPIAAVGFPVPGQVDMEVAGGLLGAAFGVKRVSPGVVIERWGGVLSHDCTTLGGSSGSPVFTLGEAASLVGVHYDGWYLTSNHAVCGAAMCEFLKEQLP